MPNALFIRFCLYLNKYMMKLVFYTFALLLAISEYTMAANQNSQLWPNILFIEVDDLNYEYLSCFGSEIVSTPNVDNLAKTGVLFKNAVAQGMMCSPSRNSVMTGLYPHNLGMYNNGEMKTLPEGIWTFPKGLQKSGYYTAWVGKSHIRTKGRDKSKGLKMQMGFDFAQATEGRVVLTKKVKKKPEVADKDWYLSFLKEQGLLEQFVNEYPQISTLPEAAYLDGFFTNEAQKFISNYKADKPFFLWLNYSVPHGPNDVAQEYHDKFDVATMPGSTKPDFIAPEALVKKTKLISNEQKHKKEQAGHSAMVSFMDKQVGKIIESLKESGQFDNTIVVFFSDQGLMMGDHQRHHKGTLFRQITNPALIVSYPPMFKQGLQVEAPVELIDLIQTTLEIAKAPDAELNHCKTSHSIVPLLTNKAKSVREYAFGEIDGYIMVSDGKYRLIKGADAKLLFDDVNDPKNLHNIASDNPKKIEELSKAVDKWLEETGPVLPKNTY